jgi:hypothetical protein
VCPECGSDETTGWSEAASSQALDLPDDSFDYDDFVQQEFGHKNPKGRLHWFWWLVAVLLLMALALLWFGR